MHWELTYQTGPLQLYLICGIISHSLCRATVFDKNEGFEHKLRLIDNLGTHANVETPIHRQRRRRPKTFSRFWQKIGSCFLKIAHWSLLVGNVMGSNADLKIFVLILYAHEQKTCSACYSKAITDVKFDTRD